MEALDRHPHAGHAVIMGKTKGAWQDTGYILSLFGQKPSLARRAYRSFVESGISQGRRPDLAGGGLVRSAGGWTALKEMRKDDLRMASDERILGSSDFVRSVLSHAHEDYEKRMRAQTMDLPSLIAFVAAELGEDESTVKSTVKRRTASRARAIIAHLGVDRLKRNGAELSRHLNVTPSAVSKLAGRGRNDPLSPEIEGRLFPP
jgi:putative transposase